MQMCLLRDPLKDRFEARTIKWKSRSQTQISHVEPLNYLRTMLKVDFEGTFQNKHDFSRGIQEKHHKAYGHGGRIVVEHSSNVKVVKISCTFKQRGKNDLSKTTAREMGLEPKLSTLAQIAA